MPPHIFEKNLNILQKIETPSPHLGDVLFFSCKYFLYFPFFQSFIEEIFIRSGL